MFYKIQIICYFYFYFLRFHQLKLHERGQKLELSIYSDVCSALLDDHENVRQCALKMMWVLSRSYAERLVIQLMDSNLFTLFKIET